MHFILIHSEFNKTVVAVWSIGAEGFEGEGEADEAKEQRGQETDCWGDRKIYEVSSEFSAFKGIFHQNTKRNLNLNMSILKYGSECFPYTAGKTRKLYNNCVAVCPRLRLKIKWKKKEYKTKNEQL